MNIEALKWFRANSLGTENNGLVYFDSIKMGGGIRYHDKVATSGLRFFGTPAEYGASYAASKYISLNNSTEKAKTFYVDYPANSKITKTTVFPANSSNERLDTKASPYHILKLNIGSNKISLSLNNNTKTWT
jgi:hypothetical protein